MTRRSVGTSITARIPNACAWCGAGRQPGGRPNGVRTMPPKPSTPRPNACAVGASHLRRSRRIKLKLQRRVVPQQKSFPTPLCDRPGCHEPPRKSGRNQTRYCCAACRR
jgi:hypothetical protein